MPDIGTGTGFLTLFAGRLGYDVTAVDLSEGRLARLRAKTASEGLLSPVVHAAADELPLRSGDLPASAVTLPDPARCLHAWRAATGRR